MRRSSTQLVMVCFSHDDRHVMTSALDNDVHLYEAFTGRDEGVSVCESDCV
jgi:hypothetical protein